jgi:hypothetical protein
MVMWVSYSIAERRFGIYRPLETLSRVKVVVECVGAMRQPWHVEDFRCGIGGTGVLSTSVRKIKTWQ